MKTLPWPIIMFLIGVFFGALFIFVSVWTGKIGYSIPSERAVKFVGICDELNQQELTAENIKKLNGVCWVNGKLERCEGQLVDRLKAGTDPFFAVYHKTLDNAWACNIYISEDGKIKTGIYYQYD